MNKLWKILKIKLLNSIQKQIAKKNKQVLPTFKSCNSKNKLLEKLLIQWKKLSEVNMSMKSMAFSLIFEMKR